MPLSHEQIQELDKYQQKFLNGEITAKEYEFVKSEILDWEDSKPLWQGNSKIKNLKDESEELNTDKNILRDIFLDTKALILWCFKILKALFHILTKLWKYIHSSFVSFSKKKGISIIKFYSIVTIWGIVCFFAIFWVIKGIYGYEEYKREQYNQKLSDERKIQEQQDNEKRLAEQKVIEAEKAKTPKPSIILLSSQGKQGKKTEYLLQFTASGADSIKMNGESISINWSGVYEKEIQLKNIETAIKLVAKNKYYSTENAFLITRDENTEDIAREKKRQEDEEYQKRVQVIMEKREWAKTNYYTIVKTCEKRVLEVLISPKTAEFPSPSVENIHFNDDKIRYNGYVDSQNAYGALIRSNYRCDVERYSEDGEEYVRTSVELY